MKPLLLVILGLSSLSTFAAGSSFEKEFVHPKLFGLSYLANDAEEVFGLEGLYQKRARQFCRSQGFDDSSANKVKYISTVKYSKEKKKFEWLSPIEMIVFENDRAVIREFKTTYHVLSAYRDPAYFQKIKCQKKI